MPSSSCLSKVAEDSATSTAPAALKLPLSTDKKEMNQQEWHRQVSAHLAADRMRGLGQRLLGLLVQRVHSRAQQSRFVTGASTVGTLYGKEPFIASINLHETVKAFLFFRRTCSQLTSPAHGIEYPVDFSEAAKLQEQIDTFIDAVLLGVLTGYESQPASLLASAVRLAAITEDQRQ